MDCKEAENLYEFYVLGALDSEERSLMDSHLETCDACNERLQQDGETVARLAYVVPQVEAPDRVKQALFSRVDADLRLNRRIGVGARLVMLWRGTGRRLASSPGAAAASVLLVALVFGGLWFDSRMNRVVVENEALSKRLESVNESLSARLETSSELSGRVESVIGSVGGLETASESLSGRVESVIGSVGGLETASESLSGRLESVIEKNAELVEMMTTQRDLIYEALRFSTQSVSLLRGQGTAWNARGMMMVSGSEPRAVLLTVNLPPLPVDKAYQVWLISGGRKYNGGLFTVDSTGFGVVVIVPVVPFSEIDALGITIEPAGGSRGPTGVNVLKGDL